MFTYTATHASNSDDSDAMQVSAEPFVLINEAGEAWLAEPADWRRIGGTITATARLTYNYEVEDGLVSTIEEAEEDLRSSLRNVSPKDFEITLSIDGGPEVVL